MKVAQINATCGIGSTGKICLSVSKLLNERGIENRIFYTQGMSNYSKGIKYSEEHYKKIQALKSRIYGNWGFNSGMATRRLIRELEKFAPDIVHIHNIHAHDCDVEMLFSYLKKKKMKVFWTFHDCWAFTGYCTHFLTANCDKWKTECGDCVKWREFSWVFDRSTSLFWRKKTIYEDWNFTVVTPSTWMANVVKQSFLSQKDVVVIHNGINLDVFKPRKSNFRDRYNLQDKKIVLGVAFSWGYAKGLDVVNKLADILSDEYAVVLVGTTPAIDKLLSPRIISIHKTENQIQLAEIYSVADIFVNPTREENYPTVHLESVACGTPVVSFDVGGCKETIPDGWGECVPCEDVERMKTAIIHWCSNRATCAMPIDKKHTAEMDEKECFLEYINLYQV